MNLEHLGVGTRLLDRYSKTGRVVVLQTRMNPMNGRLIIPPFWSVKNERTGRVTVVRESRILAGKRWIRA